jgi:hypothetical protein
MKKPNLTYYEVDLLTGEYKKCKATSELDLEITLANGDCVKTEKQARRMEYKIKTGAEEL